MRGAAWRGARITGDDRFEVDDRVGEGGAVEGLAGNLECGEEEWRTSGVAIVEKWSAGDR